MKTGIPVAVASALLFFLGLAAPIASAPPARASEAPCEPRPDPLHFTLAVDPAQPRLGDEVRVIVGLSEVDGLLLGHALVELHDASPVFDDPPFFRQDGLLQGPVTFTVQARVGGIAELTVTVDYETECACPPVCYYRHTVVSEPFLVTVAGPTATPTVVCTPPRCAGDEVFACPDTCPGGCGTICATRTPTACATPACASEEVFVCPTGTCPGSCGLVCAVRTQTPVPTSPPACSGDCDGNRVVTIDELLAIVNMALAAPSANTCARGDADGDGSVDIADIIAAVNRALRGC